MFLRGGSGNLAVFGVLKPNESCVPLVWRGEGGGVLADETWLLSSVYV